VRWLSTAAGIVGVALTAVVARRLTGRRAAAAAAGLLGLAPAFIEFSRMARYYSLVLMLGLLSTWLLLHAMERNELKRWGAYALTGLAMLYTFYPSGVLLAVHALMIVVPVRGRTALRHWLIAAGAIGIGFAPWLGAVASGQIATIAGSAGADLARSGLGFALGAAASLYTFSVGETIFPWHPAAWLGLAIVLVLVSAGLRPKAGPGRWPCAAAALLSIVFISATTTFVSVGTPFLNAPVRALFALPFYLLLAAIGLFSLSRSRIQLSLAGALLSVWVIGHFHYFTGQQSLNPIYLTPSSEAAAFVRRNATVSDLVISDYDSVFGYYFLRDGGAVGDRPEQVQHMYTHEVDAVRTALETARPPHVWLIALGRDQTSRSASAEIVRETLLANYRLERTELFLPIDPAYLKAKALLLRRESYAHRLTVEAYSRAP